MRVDCTVDSQLMQLPLNATSQLTQPFNNSQLHLYGVEKFPVNATSILMQPFNNSQLHLYGVKKFPLNATSLLMQPFYWPQRGCINRESTVL